MSAKIMGAVWDYALESTDQIVLLALADHADHEGAHVWPSVALIAWKVGMSERTVRYSMKRLRALNVLVVTRRPRQHRPTEYRIILDALTRKPQFRGADIAPLEDSRGARTASRGAIQSIRGATAVAPKPSPYPSIEPRTPDKSGGRGLVRAGSAESRAFVASLQSRVS